MRRLRLLLLVLLPAHGMVSLPLIIAVPQTAIVLAPSNIVFIMFVFFIGFLYADGIITSMLLDFIMPIIIIVFNLAFWLPVAHLVDVALERARRRRAGRGR